MLIFFENHLPTLHINLESNCFVLILLSTFLSSCSNYHISLLNFFSFPASKTTSCFFVIIEFLNPHSQAHMRPFWPTHSSAPFLFLFAEQTIIERFEKTAFNASLLSSGSFILILYTSSYSFFHFILLILFAWTLKLVTRNDISRCLSPNFWVLSTSFF